MKRLLCRGYGKIFQICRCWRENERGKRHVPEFTLLEWYRSNSDYADIMEDCRELLEQVALAVCGRTTLPYQGGEISFGNGIRRISVREAFTHYGGTTMEDALRNNTFDEIMVTAIEPALPHGVPVILMDYPAPLAALARLKPGDPSVGERFELYAGGLELANGFSELNDPHEQRLRFQEANGARARAGLPPLPLPEPFLADLGAMPPAAGIALGIDRLVMLCADTANIDDVLAFTPEEL